MTDSADNTAVDFSRGLKNEAKLIAVGWRGVLDEYRTRLSVADPALISKCFTSPDEQSAVLDCKAFPSLATLEGICMILSYDTPGGLLNSIYKRTAKSKG